MSCNCDPCNFPSTPALYSTSTSCSCSMPCECPTWAALADNSGWVLFCANPAFSGSGGECCCNLAATLAIGADANAVTITNLTNLNDANVAILKVAAKQAFDGAGASGVSSKKSIDWSTRQLFASNGSTIVLNYTTQQTTGVSSATIINGSGTASKQDDTFDGYTLAQAVKALRNYGLLA